MVNAKVVGTEQLSITFKPSTLAQNISTLGLNKSTVFFKPGRSFMKGFSDRFLSVSPKATADPRGMSVGKGVPFGQRLLFFGAVLSFVWLPHAQTATDCIAVTEISQVACEILVTNWKNNSDNNWKVTTPAM
jgi:hypothetical protein